MEATGELLKSVPGIGDVASRTPMAELPEFGRLNRREIAALRATLYMAALITICHNPAIDAFNARQRAAGKLAITACIRELFVTLNAIVRDNRPWQAA